MEEEKGGFNVGPPSHTNVQQGEHFDRTKGILGLSNVMLIMGVMWEIRLIAVISLIAGSCSVGL